MYSECIEFGMEACDEIDKDNFKQEEIFKNMAFLHKLRLIHLDIKPANIMRSPTFNKLVFIDFGFSRFVREEAGEKTLIKFYGSPTYCSNEMRRCFTSKKPAEIDLFYNDLVCLQNSTAYLRILL